MQEEERSIAVIEQANFGLRRARERLNHARSMLEQAENAYVGVVKSDGPIGLALQRAYQYRKEQVMLCEKYLSMAYADAGI